MTMVEADYRYSVQKYKKLGLAVFAGAAVLYGDDENEEGDSVYPAGGAGVFYQLNEEKMVVRADIAVGEDGNYGFYLQFGHPFER